jgi:hypothetical protein
MLVMKEIMLGLLSFIALASCSGDGAALEFYVLTQPDEGEKFIERVTAIAKEDGMETATSQLESRAGNILRVMEGRDRTQRLWVQNSPLSGQEDPKLCGAFEKPHSDPSQFIVFTQPRLFGTRAGAKELGERVLSQLQASGFEVRRTPAICGAAAIHDRS